MLANMGIISALTWYIFSTSLESRANKAIEAAVSIKIVLMYLPFLSLAVIVIVRLLRRYGLTLKQIHFLSSEEDAVDSHNLSIGKTLKHREESCADEDLFERAAEPNCSPLILTGGEAGFELRADETG